MKWLSKCKKERKITQGGKGTAGGGSSGIENENKKFFFIPLHDYLSNHAYFQLRRRKKGIATRPQHTECSAGWWEEVLPNDDQKQRIIT